MNDKVRPVGLLGFVLLCRFELHQRRADHQVAQQSRASLCRHIGGEGQHVSGACFSAVGLIEIGRLFIVGNADRQFWSRLWQR